MTAEEHEVFSNLWYVLKRKLVEVQYLGYVTSIPSAGMEKFAAEINEIILQAEEDIAIEEGKDAGYYEDMIKLLTEFSPRNLKQKLSTCYGKLIEMSKDSPAEVTYSIKLLSQLARLDPNSSEVIALYNKVGDMLVMYG